MLCLEVLGRWIEIGLVFQKVRNFKRNLTDNKITFLMKHL